jgi:hypothetical protein
VTAAPAYLYCYYRVAPAQARAARDAVAALFRAAEERFGATARLLRGEREPWLWMEVYENVREPDRLETVLAELCGAQRFAAFLAPGERRRSERFVAAVIR